MKSSWIGMGFSHHSVPSLSKTATRAAGGSAWAELSLETLSTKSRMASLAAPARQLGNGSFVLPAWSLSSVVMSGPYEGPRDHDITPHG